MKYFFPTKIIPSDLIIGIIRIHINNTTDKKEIKELVEVLHSKEIEDFINKEYKGAVVPVKE